MVTPCAVKLCGRGAATGGGGRSVIALPYRSDALCRSAPVSPVLDFPLVLAQHDIGNRLAARIAARFVPEALPDQPARRLVEQCVAARPCNRALGHAPV